MTRSEIITRVFCAYIARGYEFSVAMEFAKQAAREILGNESPPPLTPG